MQDTNMEDGLGYMRKQGRYRWKYGPVMKVKGRRHERRKVREAMHQCLLEDGGFDGGGG